MARTVTSAKPAKTPAWRLATTPAPTIPTRTSGICAPHRVPTTSRVGRGITVGETLETLRQHGGTRDPPKVTNPPDGWSPWEHWNVPVGLHLPVLPAG